MKILSHTQKKILDFIESFIAKNEYPPTIRQMQKEFGYSSTSAVQYALKKLTEKGYIKRSHKARQIEVLSKNNLNSIRVSQLQNKTSIDFSFLLDDRNNYILKINDNNVISRAVKGDMAIMRRVKSVDELKDGDIVSIKKASFEQQIVKFFRQQQQNKIANFLEKRMVNEANLLRDLITVEGVLIGVFRC